nr:CapA family protein [Gluconacetobacter asukensis]
MMMKIGLTGDSILFRRLNSTQDAEIRPLFDLIRSCDVSFTNLELVSNDFAGDPSLDHGGTHFGAPSWVLDELRDAGFDLFAAATNHSLDYGVAGLRAMLAALDRRGLLHAGIGTNLEEARRPVYCTRPAGTVAMLSCVSTFARGQEAAAQTALMPGRPGVNPLHVTRTHHVTADDLAHLTRIYERLGLRHVLDEKIRLGFAFPPAPGTLSFDGVRFAASDTIRTRTEADAQDVADIARWIGEARLVSDVVIVSVHAHESGYNADGVPDVEIPDDFLRAFTRAAVDAGADIVVCHGPHLLRGLELYRGRPIFHGLGNFIGQNELVARLPMDSYAAYRCAPDVTPHRLYKERSENDRKGFPADQRFWDSVVPVCLYEGGMLRGIDIHPVSLGLGRPAHRRGTPMLAQGAEATRILEAFAALSRPFGTELTVADGAIRLPLMPAAVGMEG